ncbi:penicillin-binding protein 2 [Treponema sp.]|uniref:penicillin-binding protein 2 n=1 Tax=Treponema sp. TaxID=166 RepID=UPI001D5073CB|nr:penicillin-binding protein 2 [Treponema sp.]MBS7241982.1 penicillin-binding protein 2 [Treponema sp.]MCI6441962.1 penicillin-binding protein 2 [Spirochaetia bacterium]MDY4131642.1 penicillin-binding protein 2 [Treponema sp.]
MNESHYVNTAFEDVRHTDNSVRKNYKVAFLFLLVVVCFSIYVLKLFSLQIINGESYRKQSVRISSTITTITPQRGEIFDRNAQLPMVINTDSFAVDMRPGEIPSDHFDTVATKLAEYLGISKSTIDNKIPKRIRNSFSPIEIKTNVSFEVISNIAENLTDLPGVSWRNKPVRNYVETGSICHVLGYVGNITSEELNIMFNSGYEANSVVGKTGIERQYDSLLKGEPGTISRTVDVHGRILNDKPVVTPPKSGKNLILTIDSRIQRLAEKALGERIGAAVVLKPASGEVIAMVSYPYFDANVFSTDDYSLQYSKLANDKDKPMLNRVVNAEYPPASTFKTIMSTAMLSEKVFPSEKKIECPGRITYGDRVFRCHVGVPGHGWLDMKNGLAQSCDVYFWVIGTDYLGVDRISSYAQEFGFGQSLEIDLPAQATGTVPTAQWKWRKYREKWLGGDTMNISIGQGYTLATPLHVANMMAMVCNSGKIYKPHLLKEVRDPSQHNEVVMEVKPEILHQSTVAPEVWKEVQRALRYTISDGTAVYPMHNTTVQIAGKTGTAEVNGYGKDHWHSWMAAYAPYDAPVEDQYVVVVLVEAANKWEWWAPYATNIIIQGLFNDQTFDEAVDALKFRYLLNQQAVQGGRRE